jgi:tetratricopeptide (TPR) repeat protein
MSSAPTAPVDAKPVIDLRAHLADMAPGLRAAVAYQRAGRPDEAEAAYRELLDSRPVDIRSYLVELASDLRAGVEHHKAGRLDEAEALYRKLIDAVPTHPRALYMLGLIETARGRPERGIELISQAWPVLSKSPEANVDLGHALRLAGKRKEAVESYRRAIALKPGYALAHSCLGGALKELGRFEAAITHCQTAIAAAPKLLAARVNLAMALREAGRIPEAVEAWREAIALEPNRADSYHQLARELMELKLPQEALRCLDHAVRLQPDNVIFHCSRGEALISMQDGEAAVAAFRQAVAVSPHAKPAWAGLGWALRLLGRFEEADDCVKRLREIDPTDLLAVRHVPWSGNQPQEAAEIERLISVLDRPEAHAEDRISAGFALGRLLDEAGRFDEAFAHYAAANALMCQTWPPTADRFDAELLARSIDAMIKIDMTQHLAEAAATGNMSELPVFIVGMPRSGTTLVEQICSSHSRIFGAGELEAVALIAAKLTREQGDDNRKAEARRQAADAHFVYLHRLGRGAVRVVDKFPDNILLVGLIAQLFPRARIVYCSRDPRDISLSCYFQRFAEKAQPFSYDLADCGRRCRAVQRLAAHWLKLLPLHMIEVNYEKLVEDLESESRRLIEFLGLDWEPACLDFHRTERTVATVSLWQVRQPLYKSSVGRWRNYERHLGPLMAALNESIETQAAPNASVSIYPETTRLIDPGAPLVHPTLL